jgi:hypothetical protein
MLFVAATTVQHTRLLTDALFYIIPKPIKSNDFHKSRLFSDERETQNAVTTAIKTLRVFRGENNRFYQNKIRNCLRYSSIELI